MIRRIAILTGNDDVPGINAVIRGATRSALHRGWEVMGVCDGFAGLITGDFLSLTARSVEGIVQWSETMLGSGASKQFSTEAGRKLALDHLAEQGVDALIVAGGEETQTGAHALSQLGFPVNGVAASVENELAGFDRLIGVDTAMNIALDSIDRLQMARAEDGNTFIVEVAGHKCGCLALMSGIASGADAIVIPEFETPPGEVADAIKAAYRASKLHPLIVVAEGAAYDAYHLRRYLAADDLLGQKLREARLSYLQRRAAPNGFDRMLGLHLGAYAVDALARGEHGVLAGSRQGAAHTIPFAEVMGRNHLLDAELLQLANTLLNTSYEVA